MSGQGTRRSALVRRLHGSSPGFWSFLGRRLSPDEYLGLHLTVGLVLSMLALLAFGWIAIDSAHDGLLKELDRTLAARLHDHALASPLLVAFFRGLTQFGSLLVLSEIGLGVALFLLLRHHRLLALVWLLALAGSALLNGGLKELFDRPRPQFEVMLWRETNPSFPSGHAMGSMVTYGLLAWLLAAGWPRWPHRIAVAFAAVVLVGLIGFSRLYLGAHWFSDVVGGFAAGTVWLAVCISGIESVRRRRSAFGVPRAAEPEVVPPGPA